METKPILYLALVLSSGGWSGCSIASRGSDEAVVAGERTGAEQYFRDYLSKCGTNEIRCLWFLDDKSNVGMVMTTKLDDYTVFTAREVCDWAEQSSETRKLSHAQVLSLKQIVKDLPASDKNAGFDRSVFVSIRKDNKTEVFQYDRRHAPAVVQRIYDICGGYFYNGNGD
jgi:hypothetical protein